MHLYSLLFSRSVMSSSLWPPGLQHARLPCPSPSPGVYSNSCPLSWWCHPTISSSVVPFTSHLQSFPASGSFPLSWLFASGGQRIGASASASVLPVNIQGWFPLGCTGWISWVQGTFKSLSTVILDLYSYIINNLYILFRFILLELIQIYKKLWFNLLYLSAFRLRDVFSVPTIYTNEVFIQQQELKWSHILSISNLWEYNTIMFSVAT